MSKDDEEPTWYKKKYNNESYVLTPDVALSIKQSLLDLQAVAWLHNKTHFGVSRESR